MVRLNSELYLCYNLINLSKDLSVYKQLFYETLVKENTMILFLT
jgi:hypothetical protein